MKILLASTLKRKVAPEITASRSRVIYELTKGLVAKGHEVTMLGTEDSYVPGAKTIGIIPRSFAELPTFENPYYAETGFLVQLAKKIESLASEFDIIHNHTYPEFINLMVADQIKTPMVTTLHAQSSELDDVLSLFPNTYFVCPSKAQQESFKKTKPADVVYHGIDTSLYAFEPNKDDYLLWIGRLGKTQNKDGSFVDRKGIRWAIQLAQKTGDRLLLSGNVEDPIFFDKEVKPYLNDKIKWIGAISSEQPLSKEEVVTLMQKAKAFLMTIIMPEPFGLVVAEAMSCGTPVIGFDHGSVSELVIDGKTGFVVDQNLGVEGLAKAVQALSTINPIDCRYHVEKHFSVEKMVDDYEEVYKKLIKK